MNYYLDAFNNYANFQGRTARKPYWMFILIHSAIVITFMLLANAVGLLEHVLTLYFLVTLVPNIAIGIRRLHDTGRTGWWALLGLIPFVSLVLIFFMVQRSTPDNQYGPQPSA